MKTRRLFEEDPKLQSCTAKVLSCERTQDGYEIVTDQTALFPESGGQLCDRGTLGGAEVTAVYERDGAIVHRCGKSFEAGDDAEITLDAETRLANSQQHTGEHMISHAFWKLFGAVNVGFHMSQGLVVIDLDRELDTRQCMEAEDYANRQIWEDRAVNIIYRQDGDLEGLDVRKATDKAEGLLRFVVIEGGDVCSCCGTHVERTGAVGLIKILRAERHRGGMRLELVCGRRALEDFREKCGVTQALVNELSCGVPLLAESVAGLKAQIKELSLSLRENSAKLMDYYAREAIEAAETAAGTRLIILALRLTAGEARQLLKRLLAGGRTVAGVFYPSGERLSYIIGKTDDAPLSCRDIADIANGLINGKGGGSDTLAQGAGKMTADWQELVDMLRAALLRML